MLCVHPRPIFIYFSNKTNKHVTSFREKTKHEIAEEFLTFEKIEKIPCGNCIICRMNKCKSWANRLVAHSTTTSPNYFVTLTYENHPGTLVKSDLQLFLKNLNQYQTRHGYDRFTYYAIGEYGSSSLRPHYHAILFGLNIDDLKLFTKNSYSNDNLYTSNTINSLWNKGFVYIGSCTVESMNYVSRYSLKKQFRARREKNFILLQGITPEFNLMSKNISKDFIEQNLEKLISTNGSFLVNGKYQSLGRYFYKYLDSHNLSGAAQNIKNIKSDIVQVMLKSQQESAPTDPDIFKKLYSSFEKNAKLFKRR